MSVDEKGAGGADAFAGMDYRKLIVWSRRLEREKGFLLAAFSELPRKRLCDLGCGTGEHSRFLFGEGFEVVGLDSSPTQLEKAREFSVGDRLTFRAGRIEDVGALLGGGFGGALSLGNTLVHLTEREELRRVIQGVASVLEPGGVFLFQVLNYARLIAQQIRYLPLNFSAAESGETVFLRLMEYLPDKRVRFCPTTLHYAAEREAPVELRQSRVVELRGWDRGDFEPLLQEAGFASWRCYGDMEQGEFREDASSDLVIVARRK